MRARHARIRSFEIGALLSINQAFLSFFPFTLQEITAESKDEDSDEAESPEAKLKE